jgi:hypothetical protein
MLYKEIMAEGSEIVGEHTNALCGNNVGALAVKPVLQIKKTL